MSGWMGRACDLVKGRAARRTRRAARGPALPANPPQRGGEAEGLLLSSQSLNTRPAARRGSSTRVRCCSTSAGDLAWQLQSPQSAGPAPRKHASPSACSAVVQNQQRHHSCAFFANYLSVRLIALALMHPYSRLRQWCGDGIHSPTAAGAAPDAAQLPGAVGARTDGSGGAEHICQDAPLSVLAA